MVANRRFFREPVHTRETVEKALMQFHAIYGRWPSGNDINRAKAGGVQAMPHGNVLRKMFGNLAGLHEFGEKALLRKGGEIATKHSN